MTSAASPSAVSVSMATDSIALITMDFPGSGANVLNEQLFAELDQTMAELAERAELRGVILYSAKPSIFVAGADLKGIVAHLDWPDEEIIRFCEKGRAVMARFSRCPFPSVAAIHGACVGGGLELALWCDGRIASDHRRTQLGLPEVKLGLVPGWAGTVRLPRISGLEVATDLVTSGRLVPAATALEMKFIDAVVPQEQLIDAAIEWLQHAAATGEFIDDRRAIMGPVPGLEDPQAPELAQLVDQRAAEILDNPRIFAFAPTVVLEHMARTASCGIKEAWDSESKAMAQVWGSPASRGLLNHFFLLDRNKKQPGLVDRSLIGQPLESVGIWGGGELAHVLCRQCAAARLPARLHGPGTSEPPAWARDLIESGQIVWSANPQELAVQPLIIETDDLPLEEKQQRLAAIEDVVSPQAAIAIQAPAVSLGQLTGALQHPERTVGLLAGPRPGSALWEVAAARQSAESTVGLVVGWVRQIRQLALAVNEGPGLVSGRLLAVWLDQALRLVDQGVPVAEIDQALVTFGFANGPLQLIDRLGLATVRQQRQQLRREGLTGLSETPLLSRLIDAGRLGRSAGAGFYRYRDSAGRPEEDPDLAKLLELPSPPQPLPAALAQRILAPVAAEALQILEEQIVADAQDLDLAAIEGWGFPAHRGGLLFWADQEGWPAIADQMRLLSAADPHFLPSPRMQQLAAQRGKLYPPA